MKNNVIAWFSCGVTSAIACKIALELYDHVRICFIKTGAEHPDSFRFLKDCEKWYRHPIEIHQNSVYSCPMDVWKKKRFLNGVHGAPCTLELKKKVRYAIEDEIKTWDCQVFGFDVSEKLRGLRLVEQYPSLKAVFPLIDRNLSKSDCIALLHRNGIEIPLMYKMGFRNNNCIGCVKGRMGYWNKIRICFPNVFKQVAEFEREIGRSCINGVFLDELPDVDYPPIVESCSIFCELEFMNDGKDR